MSVNSEKVAIEVLRCALSWEKDARIIGNVTAHELVVFVSRSILTCPSCGSTAWCNIDCQLCDIGSKLENE
jgi:hypothetical protein